MSKRTIKNVLRPGDPGYIAARTGQTGDLGVKPDDIKNYDLLDIVQDMALEESAKVKESVKEASTLKS